MPNVETATERIALIAQAEKLSEELRTADPVAAVRIASKLGVLMKKIAEFKEEPVHSGGVGRVNTIGLTSWRKTA